MAVVPLRPPGASKPGNGIIIDEAPKPSARDAKIEVDEDGVTSILFGASEDAPRPRGQRRPSDRKFNRNLAVDLPDDALAALASYLIDGIEADLDARSEWEDTANMAASYLGIVLTDLAQTSQDGTVCQSVASCLLMSAMKLWSTARAEHLPVSGPCKVKRDDAPPPIDGAPEAAEPGQPAQTSADQQKDNFAHALEDDMNWYLTVGDRGFYPDHSKMLMHRAVIGNGPKEIFHCPIEGKPISRWIMAQDFIISGNPSHLGSAARITTRKKMRQSIMRRMMVKGYFRDLALVHPTGQTTKTEITIGETSGISMTPSLPRDYEHTIYECHCEIGSGTSWDLFGGLDELEYDETGERPGYPLPYRVSMDLDSRTVLGIHRAWKKGDKDHRRRRRFVRYGFIPWLGAYDCGLIHLVGNPTQAATMLQRAGVDAGIFANFPAWIMAQGPASRMENTIFRPMPGEVMKVPVTAGAKIDDVFRDYPHREPSPGAAALVQKLEADVAKIAGIVEIPVGEGRIGNTPVGTIMSYIESVSMVPGAVHKDDFITMGEELEILRELIAEDPSVLWRGNKSPARKWQIAEEILDPDLIPAADPNTPSQIHRLTALQGLVTAAGLPQFNIPTPIPNQREIWKRLAKLLAGSPDDVTMPEQPPQTGAPPPDPRVIAAQIKAQSEAQREQSSQQQAVLAHTAKMSEIAAQADSKDKDRDAETTRAVLDMASEHAKTAAQHAHEQSQQSQDHMHDVLSAPLTAPQQNNE